MNEQSKSKKQVVEKWIAKDSVTGLYYLRCGGFCAPKEQASKLSAPELALTRVMYRSVNMEVIQVSRSGK